MARFKPVRGKAKGTPAKQGVLPCMILLISGFLLISMLFYLMLKGE
jgi:hypothetical protein